MYCLIKTKHDLVLDIRTVFVIVKLLTGLWVLLCFCLVRWGLYGTASQGFPCCPIYF